MKYFTKKWYELCQTTSEHLSLEEDEHAESYSEEYFHQLYNQKLKDWLSLQEDLSSQTFDDVYPKQMPPEFIDENMSEADILALKASYETEREEAKKSYMPPEPFDRKKATEQFHEAFLYNQERIKKILPEKILKKIADIRVFVLDKVSRDVINAVTQFCEENEKSVDETIEQYQKYFNKASKSFDRKMIENINFHDCIVKGVQQFEQFLSISFDNTGGFTDIEEIKFENYKMLKQDGLLQNSWWLYDEIYKINGLDELHVLLQAKTMDLIEFIISAEHISFER
jgi:hypothetical protein